MRLTKAQEQELYDALCEAFNETELTRVIRFSLGENLENVVPPGPFGQRVFELIAFCQRNGIIDQLITAIYKERERNPKVHDCSQRYTESRVSKEGQDKAAERPAPVSATGPGRHPGKRRLLLTGLILVAILASFGVAVLNRDGALIESPISDSEANKLSIQRAGQLTLIEDATLIFRIRANSGTSTQEVVLFRVEKLKEGP